jgi:CDP-glycerol glycerophosphotransferase
VANAQLPSHFRRRSGQLVLQTWHGTPLKRLRLDMLTFEHFRANYLKEARIEADQWTHLISPSPYCTEIFPRAFGFSNELLEIGAPRNDRLVQPGDAEPAKIRRRLGLRANQRAVLFAPTWRENLKSSVGLVAQVGFDPDGLLEALDDDIVVLFRAHSNVGAISGLGNNPRFINVTDYPDIGDLYLVADVLCTDYSSAMFDYACLNRPMVFLCPDLVHYRDELRGFYFDFVAEAPGPVVTDEGDLAEELDRALRTGPTADEQRRMDRFSERFIPLDDGMASRRAVEALKAALPG